MQSRSFGFGVFAVAMAIAAAAQAQDLGRLVHRVTDAAARGEVRIYQPGRGEVAWVATDSKTTIRKVSSEGRTQMTVEGPADKVSLTITRSGITVERAGRQVVVPGGNRQKLAAARELVAESDAVRESIFLLGRMSEGMNTPIGHQLKITRAVLLSAVGDRGGMVAIESWMQINNAPRVVSVAYQEKTPTECWNAYVKEVVLAVTQLEMCAILEPWWDFLDRAACLLVYEMRTTAALVWWLNCVGITDFTL